VGSLHDLRVPTSGKAITQPRNELRFHEAELAYVRDLLSEVLGDLGSDAFERRLVEGVQLIFANALMVDVPMFDLEDF